MAYQPIEPVGLGRNVADQMAKGGPRLQQEIKTMGPDTIKMIALQQIADQEKQRAMQGNLQAQTNPATVMQQLEQQIQQIGQPQQAMGLPAMQGKVQQVGGALAQKQQMQQRNMQRAAQAPQPRPQQPPVRAAMGGLMTQRAPNIDPRYFESGGIVAFDSGGFTTDALEALRRRMIQRGDTSALALDEAGLAALMPKTTSLGERASDIFGGIDAEKVIKQYPRDAKRLLGEDLYNETVTRLTAPAAPALTEQSGADETVEVVKDSQVDITGTEDGSSGAPQVEVQEQEKERVYEQIDAPAGIEIPASLKQAGAKPSTAGIQGLLGKLSTDPNTERDSAAEFYKKQRALSPELQGKKEGIEAEIERRYNQAGGVDKRRALREMFAAAGGTGSLGTLGSRMSGALSSAQDTAQARKDKLFGEYNESINKLVGRSDEIASGALTYGQKEKENAKQDIRAALNTASALYQSESADARAARTSEANMVIANAGNEVRTNIANLSAKVQQQTTAALNEFREASLGADDVKSQRQLIGTLAAAKQKAETAIAASLAKITRELAFAVPPDDFKGTPEEYRQEVVDAAMRRMTDSLAPIDALLAEFGGNLGVDMSVGDPDELETLLQKYKAQ